MKQEPSYKPYQYWDALLDDTYNEAGVCWPDWPLSYNKWLHEQQRRTFHALLKKHNIALEDKKVCEIGPGIGFWTKQFRINNVKTYRGLEISHAAVERLSRLFPFYEFECVDFGTYEPTPVKAECCDFGLSVLVFLHVTDNKLFRKCVENLYVLLAPGAYLLILDAVSVNPVRGLLTETGDTGEFERRHHNKIRYYRDYVNIYERAGFSLCDVRPAFTLTQPAFDFHSWIPYALFSLYFRFFLNPLLRFGGEYLGNWLGRILVRTDEILSPFTGKGFSSKWFVFRKNNNSAVSSNISGSSVVQ